MAFLFFFWQDVSDFFCTLPASGLEWTVSPRAPSFWWLFLFVLFLSRKQYVKMTIWVLEMLITTGSIFVSGPLQGIELRKTSLPPSLPSFLHCLFFPSSFLPSFFSFPHPPFFFFFKQFYLLALCLCKSSFNIVDRFCYFKRNRCIRTAQGWSPKSDPNLEFQWPGACLMLWERIQRSHKEQARKHKFY